MENFTQAQNTAATMIAIALLTRYIIGNRQFKRRGVGGLQQFSSYWVALLTTLMEWVLRWTANILFCIGVFILLTN